MHTMLVRNRVRRKSIGRARSICDRIRRWVNRFLALNCSHQQSSQSQCIRQNVQNESIEHELSRRQALADSSWSEETVTNHFGLAFELARLIELGWYWGQMARPTAEHLISNQIVGTFLLRDSNHAGHLLSITFKCQLGVFHTRIEQQNGQFALSVCPSRTYASIIDLLHQTIRRAHLGHFLYIRSKSNSQSFPVCLLYPLHPAIDLGTHSIAYHSH